MNDFRISLMTSFVLKLKGVERIDGDVLWSCLYCCRGTQTNEAIHREKWMSAESDGMVGMISLHFIYLILTFFLVS